MGYDIDVLSSFYDNMPGYKAALEINDLPPEDNGHALGTTSAFNNYVVFTYAGALQESTTERYPVSQHYDMIKKGSDIISSVDVDNFARTRKGKLTGFNALGAIASITESQPDSLLAIHGRANAKIQPHFSTAPTAKELISFSRDDCSKSRFGPAPYAWSDFLYCKYYGEIPNNYLITLRRYPYAVSDNITTPNNDTLPPIAQAITWLGEDPGNKLSDVMKLNFGVLWKEIEAEVQNVDGNEKAMGSGVEGIFGQKAVAAGGAAATVLRGSYARWSGAAEKQQEWSKTAYTNSGPYWNQLYGPVNVVHKSHMRDRGVAFTHEITLKFQYTLQSHAGINARVAMLDLITNFLLLTYTNAKFWGGATRYFPNMANRVGFLGDQNAFYSGNYGNYAKSIGSALQGASTQMSGMLSKIMSGDFSSALKSVLSTATGLGLGKLSEKTMPNMLSIRSMLSGEPIGEWHLTVGNPMNPIAVIGNLICTDCQMILGDMLGADDFPNEVTFIVKLKPGKPRDKGDIESMFNYGFGRMTYAPFNDLPSQNNTFGKKDDKGKQKETAAKYKPVTAAEVQDVYNGLIIELKGASSALGYTVNSIKDRWGKVYADSKNLTMMLGSTRSNF